MLTACEEEEPVHVPTSEELYKMHLNSAFDKLSEYRLEKYCENFQEGREEQIAALREEMGPENGDRVRWTVEVWDERCADQ